MAIFNKHDQHSKLRRGQMITTFGPGSLVNLEIGSFIAMGIDSWDDSGRQDIIYDERLQSKLGVKYFRQPPSAETWARGVPYKRFPRWLFCPICRNLKIFEKWIDKNDDRKFSTPPRCNGIKCNLKEIIPMSLLVACRKGHLDEFPWVSWVHRSDNNCGEFPILKYEPSLSGVGLGGSLIACKKCDASRTLEGAFSSNTLNLKCTGATPWSKNNNHQVCNEQMITVQRGASNVYFSRIFSSITIPPYTDKLFGKIRNNEYWTTYTMLLTGDLEIDDSTKNQLLAKIAEQIDSTFEDVKKCVNKMQERAENLEKQSELDYRFDEYQAFLGNYNEFENNKRDFDVQESNYGVEYSKYGIDKIFLVKSLREVRALDGFTRINPTDFDLEFIKGEQDFEISEPVKLTNKEGHKALWKPAIEVRGEGIFITFNMKKLDDWARLENIIIREKLVNKNLKESCDRRHIIYKSVSAKYLLLHTFAHLLIRQLSFESGYSEASLRERIYCNSSSSINKMQGILIYTAAGDADGTLGGLVRQAKPERFSSILDSLIENSLWCANDPLCIESKGQGFESLNLSACFACALLPETSCEEFNKFLDRALVIGSPDRPELGFLKIED